jgi:hypothetical protein
LLTPKGFWQARDRTLAGSSDEDGLVPRRRGDAVRQRLAALLSADEELASHSMPATIGVDPNSGAAVGRRRRHGAGRQGGLASRGPQPIGQESDR